MIGNGESRFNYRSVSFISGAIIFRLPVIDMQQYIWHFVRVRNLNFAHKGVLLRIRLNEYRKCQIELIAAKSSSWFRIGEEKSKQLKKTRSGTFIDRTIQLIQSYLYQCDKQPI